MATAEAPAAAPAGEPLPQRFALTVQPASTRQAWHAWLRTEAGQELDFANPIDLLRHLAQLHTPPPPGTLK